MTNGGPKLPQPDWVKEEGFEIDLDDHTLENIERAKKAGYSVEVDGDSRRGTVTERTIIKGEGE